MHDALKPLVESRWLDEASTSAAEVAGLRTVVERNLDEARGPLKYADTRFWLAYQAVLAAATSVIRAHGARVRRARQHERTFAALRQLGILGVSDRARYYDDCRPQAQHRGVRRSRRRVGHRGRRVATRGGAAGRRCSGLAGARAAGSDGLISIPP